MAKTHVRQFVFSSESQGIPCKFNHGRGCVQHLCLFGTKCSKIFGRSWRTQTVAFCVYVSAPVVQQSFWLTWGGDSQGTASLQDQPQFTQMLHACLVSGSVLCVEVPIRAVLSHLWSGTPNTHENPSCLISRKVSAQSASDLLYIL